MSDKHIRELEISGPPGPGDNIEFWERILRLADRYDCNLFANFGYKRWSNWALVSSAYRGIFPPVAGIGGYNTLWVTFFKETIPPIDSFVNNADNAVEIKFVPKGQILFASGSLNIDLSPEEQNLLEAVLLYAKARIVDKEQEAAPYLQNAVSTIVQREIAKLELAGPPSDKSGWYDLFDLCTRIHRSLHVNVNGNWIGLALHNKKDIYVGKYNNVILPTIDMRYDVSSNDITQIMISY